MVPESIFGDSDTVRGVPEAMFRTSGTILGVSGDLVTSCHHIRGLWCHVWDF